MATIAIQYSPTPVVHSAAYHVLVQNLTAGNNIRVTNYSAASGAGFADTPVTGVADVNGDFACAITAQATLGWYILSVEDTTAAKIVALSMFNVT